MVGIIITGIICITLIIIAAIGTMNTGTTKEDELKRIENKCGETFGMVGKDIADLRERVERLEDVH